MNIGIGTGAAQCLFQEICFEFRYNIFAVQEYTKHNYIFLNKELQLRLAIMCIRYYIQYLPHQTTRHNKLLLILFLRGFLYNIYKILFNILALMVTICNKKMIFNKKFACLKHNLYFQEQCETQVTFNSRGQKANENVK